MMIIIIWPISVLADSAKSSVVMDLDSGRVMYQKDMNQKRLIASTTKIMTAIVAIENGELTKKLKSEKKFYLCMELTFM